jgi:LysM repeat protein
MKRLLIILFVAPLFIMAQNKPLLIEGVAPDLYVNHSVAAKENYYSIGRIYNISPKEIAPYNKLVLENGLSLGQALKIPLSTTNFLQAGDAGADEVLIPVYHKVDGKEGLYRISVNYNKLPVETLKQWNNLKGESVSNGTNLIVGYLKVKKDLSPLANMAKAKPVDAIAKKVDNPNKTIAAKEAGKPDISKEVLPPVKNNATEKIAPIAEKIKKEPVMEVVVKEPEPAKKIAYPVNGKTFNGGIFKPDYEQQIRNKDVTSEKGEAGIFKSTSGWEDGKYYCLHNTSSPGTIIKITNSATGKSVYAKVLDMIPDMAQNNGILIRLSNAASAELGNKDAKFDCSVSFSK